MHLFRFCPPERCLGKSWLSNQEILLPNHIWSAGRSASFIKFHYVDLQNTFLRLRKSWIWSVILLFLGLRNASVWTALVMFSQQQWPDEQSQADTNGWLFSCTAAFSLGAGRPRSYVSEWNINRLLEVPSIRGVKNELGGRKPTAFN